MQDFCQFTGQRHKLLVGVSLPHSFGRGERIIECLLLGRKSQVVALCFCLLHLLSHLQQFLYHFLVGEQALQIVGETLAEHVGEEVALNHVGLLLLLDFFFHQFGEQFHRQVALLHVLHLLDEGVVKERELYLAVAEEIDDSVGLHTLTEQVADALVDFMAADFALLREFEHHHAQRIHVAHLRLLLLIQKRTAERGGVVKQIAVLHEILLALNHGWRTQEVGSLRDGEGPLRVVLFEEAGIVETMKLVSADFHLFLPFHQGGLGDVGVSEAAAVTVGVLLHGTLQRLRNAYVIHYQSAFLAREHSVHSGYCLHQVMTAHRLIYVHGGERRNIEAREPHVSYDGDFHLIVVVLEFPCQFLLVGFVADNRLPVFGVLVRTAHHHLNFLRPLGAKFQHLAVDFDGDASGQRYDHCLAGEFLRTVFLVVLHNIPYQRVDGGVFTQKYFQPAVLLLRLPDLLLGGSLIGKVVELIVQQLHRVFVEVQVHHTALVIDRTGGSIIYRLTHVVNVDVVAEHFLRVSVAVADRRSGEADK